MLTRLRVQLNFRDESVVRTIRLATIVDALVQTQVLAFWHVIPLHFVGCDVVGVYHLRTTSGVGSTANQLAAVQRTNGELSLHSLVLVSVRVRVEEPIAGGARGHVRRFHRSGHELERIDAVMLVGRERGRVG
jgi:hypothetical protein